jgi:cobalt-zinc-cadmium efflux system outer membrane protein
MGILVDQACRPTARFIAVLAFAAGQLRAQQLTQQAVQQAPPISLSVQEAVDRALATHPALTARAESVSAAMGLVEQSRLRPNPTLFAQSENWNVRWPEGVGPTHNDQFFYASQRIETADKRQRRVELSEASLRLTGLDRDLAMRQIAARVRQAYWAALGAQSVVDLLQESLE